jgi:plasmid stability protein
MRKQGDQTRKNQTFSARIDSDLARLLRERAARNDRGIGAELNRILREALADEAGERMRPRKGGR